MLICFSTADPPKTIHFQPVSRSVRLSIQLEIFGKGPYLELEKCCVHFCSFSLFWPLCPRPHIGPKRTKHLIWHVPCLKMEKNFRFALGEMKTKENLNRRSRNRTETVLGNFCNCFLQSRVWPFFRK